VYQYWQPQEGGKTMTKADAIDDLVVDGEIVEDDGRAF
jgi:hypothetical protein